MARRGVFKPPYAAARALTEWAVDLWPYVNGKALVSGLRLGEMDAPDMLDVIHYFFEEDLVVSSGEQQESRSETRSVVYRTLYNTPYKYAIKKSSKASTASGDELPSDGFFGDEISPFDPSEKVTKPYIEPTDFDADNPLPFGRTLDAPLG